MKNKLKNLKKKTIFLISIVFVVIVGSVVAFAYDIGDNVGISTETGGGGGGCGDKTSCWPNYNGYSDGAAIRGMRISIIDSIGNQKASADFIFNSYSDTLSLATSLRIVYGNTYNYSYYSTNKVTYILQGVGLEKSTSRWYSDGNINKGHYIGYVELPNFTSWFGTTKAHDSTVLFDKYLIPNDYANLRNLISKFYPNPNTGELVIVEPLTVIRKNNILYYGTVYELYRMTGKTDNVNSVYTAMAGAATLENSWNGFEKVNNCDYTNVTEKNGCGFSTFNIFRDTNISKTWDLTINKVDFNTGASLNGATFNITCTDSKFNWSGTVNGTKTIQNIPESVTCYVEENSAPTSYVKLDGGQTLSINRPTYTFKNKKIQQVCNEELSSINKNGSIKSKYDLIKLYFKYYNNYGTNYNYSKLLDFDSPECKPADTTENVTGSCIEPYKYNVNSNSESLEPEGYTYISAIRDINFSVSNGANTAYCYYSVSSKNTYFKDNLYDNSNFYPVVKAGMMLWGIDDINKSLLDFNIQVNCKYVYTNATGLEQLNSLVPQQLNESMSATLDSLINVNVNGRKFDTTIIPINNTAESCNDGHDSDGVGCTISNDGSGGFEKTWTKSYNVKVLYNNNYAWRYIKGSGIAVGPSQWDDACKNGMCTDIVYGFPTALTEEEDCGPGSDCGIDIKTTIDGKSVSSLCHYEINQEFIDKETKELNLDYRIIDTSSSFPGINGSGRYTGANWCSLNSTITISKDIDNSGNINAEDALNLLKQSKSYYMDEAISILKYVVGLDKSEYITMADCTSNNALVTSEITNSNNSYNKLGKVPIISITLTPNDIRDIRTYNKNRSYDDDSIYCDSNGNCRSKFIDEMYENGKYNSGLSGSCIDGTASVGSPQYCVGE